MKAFICESYGGAEVLKLHEVEKPIPSSTEIVIQTKAISITASDSIVRSMNLPFLMKILAKLALGWSKPRKPILGQVFSGIIIEKGSKVRDFEIGDHVCAHTFMKFGAFAEFVSVDQSSAVISMPHEISFTDSATLPYGGTLALYCIEKSQIQSGQTILIYGASGAIGTKAVQIAKAIGATVHAVCSGKNAEMVLRLGADKVFDYTAANFKLPNTTYHVIFDAVGRRKSNGLKYKHAFVQNGKFISIDDDNPGTKAVSKQNVTKLREMYMQQQITAVIDRIYPFHEMHDAHTYVDKGHKKGDVLVCL